VIAAQDSKVTARVWITAFFNILDPCSIHADGDIMFCFTSNSAGMTADAAVLINDESVAHSKPFKSAKSDVAVINLPSDIVPTTVHHYHTMTSIVTLSVY
jgi:hypothetical protein